MESRDSIEEKQTHERRRVLGVRLEPSFWRKVKHAAVDARRSLEDYVESALAEKMIRGDDHTSDNSSL